MTAQTHKPTHAGKNDKSNYLKALIREVILASVKKGQDGGGGEAVASWAL
jgi:hypothetical protein